LTSKKLPDFTAPIRTDRETTSSYRENRKIELATEAAKRRIETLNLYRPMERQERFHACGAKRRLLIGGNRSGKTVSAMIELARVATGRDPYDKYPARDCNIVLVGGNWTHFRLTLVPKLVKAGLFRIIRDLVTGDWRSFDPVLDVGREHETKPSPPLIPPRFIKNMSWINKGKSELASLETTTDSTIYCFSSDGVIPQGFPAHYVGIDEDVEQEEWVDEMQARTSDAIGVNRAGKVIQGGSFVWSAMPHSKNEALLSLHERAEAEINSPDPRVVAFCWDFLGNPHISAKERTETMRDWAARGDDVLRMRAYGEFTMDSVRMYPNFNMPVHGMTPEELAELCNSDEKELFQPPLDWCRYMAVDPGHDTCAVLFAAIPPSEQFILLYDELYIHQCNAEIFGKEVARKAQGYSFRSFIIDAHGGRLTDFGSGLRPRELYSRALRENKIKSEAAGYQFIDGCDDKAVRADAVRVWLHSLDRNPYLRVLKGPLPNFLNEIKRYKKKTARINGRTVVLDEPVTRGAVHLMQALEYLAAYKPKYHQPAQPKKAKSFAYTRLQNKRKKRGRGTSLVLAPGA
jgi:hypothetical protein